MVAKKNFKFIPTVSVYADIRAINFISYVIRSFKIQI